MPSKLIPLLRKALLGAAVCIAPAFAALPVANTIDPSGFVLTATEKKAAKPKAAAGGAKKEAAKPAAGKGKGKKPGGQAAAGKGKGKKPTGKAAAKKDAEDRKPGPLADFGKTDAPDDVVHVANWVSYTRNNKKKAFVVIDKKEAQLYVFAPDGKLRSRTPILLGKAIGDYTVPGVGDKPMSQVKEHEKTTPAGRFLAQPGKNTHGEDIIWIDYKASVSMHRLRKVSAEERRAERLATPEPDDNRISYGCVNVPPKFYNGVLRPAVMKHGAYVYVLPETKTAQQLFGSYDVRQDKVQLAQAPGDSAGKAGK